MSSSFLLLKQVDFSKRMKNYWVTLRRSRFISPGRKWYDLPNAHPKKLQTLAMAKQRSPKQLAKFIDYILARRPDEFGLVVDAEGFVKIKELLKALHEEVGWKYVRRSHLNEIMITLPQPTVEILENKIRAKTRHLLPKSTPTSNPPKLLYTCVRRKAYPSVREKGIHPSGHCQIVLSSNRELAHRIGKRMDPSPVVLTVHTQQSTDKGVRYHQAGEALFLSDHVPVGCFTGPPLPKEKPVTKKPEVAGFCRKLYH